MSRVVQLFREFRERRIFHIVISYLAAGWLVLQVVDQLVANDLLPRVAYVLTFIWYLCGFPAILMVGWFHGEKGIQKAPKLEVFSLSILGFVCVALSSSAVSSHRAGQLASEAAAKGMNLHKVAVMYFEDITRGGELQYLAEGLTEELISELERVRELEVISRNGVAQFREADLPPDSIGQLLGVGTLVDGTIERVGDRVRVTLRLMDGSGAEYQRAMLERPVGEVFELRTELAKETSRMLRQWLGDEIELRTLAAESRSPVAWALYQRAEKFRKDAERLHREDDHAASRETFDRADSLLAQAESVDTAWVDPILLRGQIAYRRSRMAHGARDAKPWIDLGIRQVERALARDRANARALELRGSLRYWNYILQLGHDPDPALLAAARDDLERAVELDRSLASAYSTLSHLYYRDDVPSAVLAARNAYEEDAYLDAASEVLWRLFSGYYDLNDPPNAARWCTEGARRFADDVRFAECRLWVMTMPEPIGDPQVDLGWRLVAAVDSLAPDARRPYLAARARMIMGGVLARAGQVDSARAVFTRTRRQITPATDPTSDLVVVEAYLRTLAGDDEEALSLMKRMAAIRPGYHFDHHWWWQGLRDEPGFAALRADH